MLSTHFSEEEILREREVGEIQVYLAKRLALDQLEPIRGVVGCPLWVNDGIRWWERHLDLKAQNLNPSLTSDHSFGLEWNRLGVGAVDIFKYIREGAFPRQPRPFTEPDYHHIVSILCEDPEDPPWGQLIWYRKRGHIHVANHRTVLYSAEAIERLPFRRYKARTYIKE
jgi:hypothetical protein